jgi:hypothetical protein
VGWPFSLGQAGNSPLETIQPPLDGNRRLGRPKTPNLSLLAHETCAEPERSF